MAMLTPFDEYPVHQASRPFSVVPSTDFSWDDGYYTAVLQPDLQLLLATGLRVNPNTDMIGGYAIFNRGGQQFTVRFKRVWRPDFRIGAGPFSMEFLEPLKRLRILLEPNDSGLSFDIIWEGVSPAFLEHHHTAVNRCRMTTDQTRYTQPGKGNGFINFKGRRYEVSPESWTGVRDHSWGLYGDRPPLKPVPSLLPPVVKGGASRALRLWTCFRTEPYSGFYHLHETADGVQCEMSDTFGGPFEGHIFEGWSASPIVLTSGTQRMEFQPGSRLLKRAVVEMRDEQGRPWKQEIEVASPPMLFQTMGYTPGSWKDGGMFHTYHGPASYALEWEDFDFSVQPVKYRPYKVTGESSHDNFGMYGGDYDRGTQGIEHVSRVTTYAPDGKVCVGAAQVEHFIHGPYKPYGFE